MLLDYGSAQYLVSLGFFLILAKSVQGGGLGLGEWESELKKEKKIKKEYKRVKEERRVEECRRVREGQRLEAL